MAANRKTKLKSELFDKNVKQRGNVPMSERQKSRSKFPVGPIALAFFLFVVVGSAILQIIQSAQRGLPGM